MKYHQADISLKYQQNGYKEDNNPELNNKNLFNKNLQARNSVNSAYSNDSNSCDMNYEIPAKNLSSQYPIDSKNNYASNANINNQFITEEDASGDAGMSFWDIGQYKKTVKRIEDGHKLCSEYYSMVQERCSIEEAYAKSLKAWSKKWSEKIEKGPEYGTMQNAWFFTASEEADRLASVHLTIRDNLYAQVLKSLKDWQKENYHKTVVPLNHLKESKEMEELFRKTQKPWAKLYKKVLDCKKCYHLACKYEKTASVQEANSRSDSTKSPEEQKRLREKVEKCQMEVTKSRQLYQTALTDLNAYNPKYMEDMKEVFEKCQRMEEFRMSFFKQMLYHIEQNLNPARYQDLIKIYDDYRNSIDSVDIPRDLAFFNSNHGIGMPMNWPIFQEYSPELHSISKKGILKAATSSGQSGGDSYEISGGAGSVTLKSIVHKDKQPIQTKAYQEDQLSKRSDYYKPSYDKPEVSASNGSYYSQSNRPGSYESTTPNDKGSPYYAKSYDKTINETSSKYEPVKMRSRITSIKDNGLYQEPSAPGSIYRSYGNLANNGSSNLDNNGDLHRSRGALNSINDNRGLDDVNVSNNNTNNKILYGKDRSNKSVSNYKGYHDSHYASTYTNHENGDIYLPNEERNNIISGSPEDGIGDRKSYFEKKTGSPITDYRSGMKINGTAKPKPAQSSLANLPTNTTTTPSPPILKESFNGSSSSSTNTDRRISNGDALSRNQNKSLDIVNLKDNGSYKTTSKISLYSPKSQISSGHSVSRRNSRTSFQLQPDNLGKAVKVEAFITCPTTSTNSIYPNVTECGKRMKVLYDYQAQEDDEINLKTGEIIFEISGKDDQGWARGKTEIGREGLYPAEYVAPA